MLQLSNMGAPLVIDSARRKRCEYYLRLWAPLERALTRDPALQSSQAIHSLIHYEVRTRRRPLVLDRLVARRAKLIRQEETEQIREYMAEHPEVEEPTDLFTFDKETELCGNV